MAFSTSDSLLQRLKARDRLAWERFAILYTPLIYAWCRKTGLQPADASEISSEITHSVFDSIQKFEPGKFRSWLRVVTRNRILDFSKKKKPVAIGGSTFQASLEQVSDPRLELLDEDEDSAARETTFLFLRAMDLIRNDYSPQHFAIFRCCVVDGRPPADVADEFGVSRDNVYKIKSRVLQRLREEFGEVIEA